MPEYKLEIIILKIGEGGVHLIMWPRAFIEKKKSKAKQASEGLIIVPLLKCRVGCQVAPEGQPELGRLISR